MRIGIDGRELGGEPTGVGRYLRRLLAEWSRGGVSAGHRFTVYSPDGRIAMPPDFPGEVVLVPGAGGTRWEQGALAAAVRRDRPDVLFAPGYTAPVLSRVPTVVVIHDVSFLAHPEWFGRGEGLRRRVLVRLTARRARAVVTVSNFSRDEIVTYLGVPRERIRVVPNGIGLESPRPDDARREALVLFVGTIFNRRHLPLLVQAFARVAPQNPAVRLVVVGKNRTHPQQDLPAIAASEGMADRVSFHEWVADAELASLYARASAFAFLSEYEGFGLTPLEALAAGVPPVVLDTPAAREIYGDAALRVAPEVDEVAAALTDLLDASSPRREALMRVAPDVLSRYSWTRAAAETLAVLEEAGRP
jgi:glycosyltransferase involved in cell wall biosynthesis